jgi:hypothetical protein
VIETRHYALHVNPALGTAGETTTVPVGALLPRLAADRLQLEPCIQRVVRFNLGVFVVFSLALQIRLELRFKAHGLG